MWLAFSTYIFLVIVRPHEWWPALAGMPVLPVALLAAFAMWMFRSGKTLSTPQHLAVPVFVFAAIFSRAAMGWFGGALTAAEDLLPSWVFFLIAASLAERPLELERVLKVCCLSTLAPLAHGLDQVLTDGVGWTGQSVEATTGFPRIQYVGLFADPNDLAMLFVGCVPLCAHFARNAGALPRLFWWTACAALIYGVFLTNSRGGLLALLGVLLLWGALRLGKAATATLAALALPALIAGTRLTTGLDTEEASTAGRIDAWYTALQLFEQNPIFGVGYGLFTDHHLYTAHNSWMLVLAETGFLGYGAWFAATTISLLMLWRMRTAPSPADAAAPIESLTRDKSLADGLFWSTLGLLVAAFFLSRSYNLLFFLVWGWSAGHCAGFVRRNPAFKAIDLRAEIWRWLLLAGVSIVLFFVVVRVLLVVL
jgi:putative inorganic carbon (HCO3(-)) transporter